MTRLILLVTLFLFAASSTQAQLTLDGETYAEANNRTEKMLNDLVALDARFVPAAASLRSRYGADSLNVHSLCPDVRSLNDILMQMEAISKEAMKLVQAGKLKGYPETENSVRKIFTIMLKKRVYDLSPFIQWGCKLPATDPFWAAAADSVPVYRKDLLLAKYYSMDTEIETLDRGLAAAQKDAAVLAAKRDENRSYLCRIYKQIGEDTEEIAKILLEMERLNIALKMKDITDRVQDIKPNLSKLRFLVATEKYRYKCE